MRSERAQQRKYKRDRIKRTKQIIERVLLTICLIALLAIGSSAILTKATTTEAKAVANNVYEAIRYSDPMTNDALSSLESEITIKYCNFLENACKSMRLCLLLNW